MNRPKWRWKDVRLPRGTAKRLALEFQANLLEASLSSVVWDTADGHDVELLMHLGDLYSRLGRLNEGLEVDQTLVRINPNEPIFLYNLACSHSRLGDIEPAFEALERAIELGYQNFEHLKRDRDLDNLKKHERFYRLLEQFDTSW